MRILTINVNRFRGEKAEEAQDAKTEENKNLQDEKKDRIEKFVEMVKSNDVDVVVFTEVDNTTTAVSMKSDDIGHYREALIKELRKDNCFKTFYIAPWILNKKKDEYEKNGAVLIATKVPAIESQICNSKLHPSYCEPYNTWTRQVAIEVEVEGIFIYGVYAPDDPFNRKKFWDECITPVQEKLKNRKSIIIGDFNEHEREDVYKKFGKPSKLRAKHDQQRSKLDELKKDDWVDAWEEKHKNYKAAHDMDRFTYYYKIIDSNPIPTMQSYGRRLDYAFLSKSLSKHLVAAEHLHDVRQDGLSDHSALLIELDLGEENNQAAQQP